MSLAMKQINELSKQDRFKVSVYDTLITKPFGFVYRTEQELKHCRRRNKRNRTSRDSRRKNRGK